MPEDNPIRYDVVFTTESCCILERSCKTLEAAHGYIERTTERVPLVREFLSIFKVTQTRKEG